MLLEAAFVVPVRLPIISILPIDVTFTALLLNPDVTGIPDKFPIRNKFPVDDLLMQKALVALPDI